MTVTTTNQTAPPLRVSRRAQTRTNRKTTSVEGFPSVTPEVARRNSKSETC